MFTAHREQNEKINILRLEGDLVFQNCLEIRNCLVSALSAPDIQGSVAVDLDGVGSFDLAGVQLLIAASRSSVKRGLEFSLHPGHNTDYFLKLCHFSGLSSFCRYIAGPSE